MRIQYVPSTGPWFMGYRVLPGTCGAMLSSSDRDIAVSGGAFGFALVIGWRTRTRTFRERKVLLGRER